MATFYRTCFDDYVVDEHGFLYKRQAGGVMKPLKPRRHGLSPHTGDFRFYITVDGKKIFMLSNKLERNEKQSSLENGEIEMPVSNLLALCFAMGQQGGTLNQVAHDLDVKANDILHANEERMGDLLRLAQSYSRKKPSMGVDKFPPHKKLYQDIFDWTVSCGKLPLETEMDDLIRIIRRQEPTEDMKQEGIEACYDKFTWAEEVDESDLRDLCKRVYNSMNGVKND